MKKARCFKSLTLAGLGLIVGMGIFLTSCKEGTEDVTILVEQSVTVPGGGGGVDITFVASNGDRIRIRLEAVNTALEPYGYLQYPDGTAEYYPPIDTALNGKNSIELSLNQSGTYVLTVFDGANLGGIVKVIVEILP